MSIRAQRFGAAAAPLGAELLVSPEAHAYLSGPSLAGDPAAASWWPGTAPTTSRRAATGPTAAPLAGHFVVDSYTTAFQGYPRVAADGGGNW